MHGMPREQPVPPPQHWGPPQTWGPPPNIPPGGPGFGGNPQFIPPRPQDSYYPTPDAPAMEKQPHYGISAYGREAPPSGASATGNQPLSHAGSQVSSIALSLKMACDFIWLVCRSDTDFYVFLKGDS